MTAYQILLWTLLIVALIVWVGVLVGSLGAGMGATVAHICGLEPGPKDLLLDWALATGVFIATVIILEKLPCPGCVTIVGGWVRDSNHIPYATEWAMAIAWLAPGVRQTLRYRTARRVSDRRDSCAEN